MVTLLTVITVVKQWIQVWDPVLHMYEFNCNMRMVWLQWLSNLTLQNLKLWD
jgi:hypothetical protein